MPHHRAARRRLIEGAAGNGATEQGGKPLIGFGNALLDGTGNDSAPAKLARERHPAIGCRSS